MLRLRLIFGLSLSAAIIALLLLDGHFAAQPHPRHPIQFMNLDLNLFLYNGLLSTLCVLALTLFTARELLRFAGYLGYRPFGFSVMLFSTLMVTGPYFAFNIERAWGSHDESWAMLAIAVALGVTFFLQAVRRGTQQVMINLAMTTFILVYTGGLAGYMTKLRMEVGGQAGVAVLLFSNFIVKMTDTGAFFVGRIAGRHKMIEWLSPKKTWEGFVGGLAVATALSLLIGPLLQRGGLLARDGAPLMRAEWLAWPWGFLLFGLLMGVASVAGDLCASLLKRDAAVKDSGTSLPGLGGVLDVMDSPLLAAPVAWFFWTRLAAFG
ncbi:Phosphatidate cytidylyltransferase [Phycisphaerae bacterium RAS1]|nr:Phosphatidate cytidylyltransferase [Phycisphaerae bacterium RAS1]